MKQFVFFALICFISGCSKKEVDNFNAVNSKARYKDEIFTNVIVTENIRYGQSLSATGTGTEQLYLDLYQPEGDTTINRPVVIGVHGGGFIAGDKREANWPEVCKAFARRGYVAASVNYRLGRNAGEQFEPGWRAMQDVKAAIRFARANASLIKINTSKVFVMGSSAGGATCLITTFMDLNEVPSTINQAVWGSLEGNSGNPGYNSAVNGMVSLWGGMPDTLGINNNIPVACIHSMYDPTSPYKSEYNSSTGITTYGSFSINQRAKNMGYSTDLKTYYFNGHDDGLYPPYLDTTIRFAADFLYLHAK